VDGERITSIPGNIRSFEKCRPVYEDFEGWMEPTTGATSFEELPPLARAYVRRLEEITGVPAELVSVGPRRASTIRVSPSEDLVSA
jgi:adenylosuccinate synthase